MDCQAPATRRVRCNGGRVMRMNAALDNGHPPRRITPCATLDSGASANNSPARPPKRVKALSCHLARNLRPVTCPPRLGALGSRSGISAMAALRKEFRHRDRPELAELGRCRFVATRRSVATVYRTVQPVAGAQICGVRPRESAVDPTAAAGDSTFFAEAGLL
jgi:hypothetical protein